MDFLLLSFSPPYGKASLQIYLNLFSNKYVFIIYKNAACEIQTERERENAHFWFCSPVRCSAEELWRLLHFAKVSFNIVKEAVKICKVFVLNANVWNPDRCFHYPCAFPATRSSRVLGHGWAPPAIPSRAVLLNLVCYVGMTSGRQYWAETKGGEVMMKTLSN